MKNKNNNLIVSFVGLLVMFIFASSPSMASARVVGGGGQYLLITDEYVEPKPAPTPVVVTSKPAPSVVTKAPTKNTVTSTANNSNNPSNSNLSANAFLSGASFMPNTLLGWIFLFILILLGVKLWRSATITEKEKNAPLKHA